MRKLIRSRSKKRGLPPGTPVYTGEKKPEAVRITVMDYDGEQFLEKPFKKVEDCFVFKDKPSVTWINISSIHDETLVRTLSERFGLHPLVQEDILNADQRPKMEDYADYIYLVLKMLQWDGENGEILIEQVSLIIGSNFVISFQEREGDVFDPIRDRIRTGKGRIRKMGADYLAYSLIDAIVDGYFIVLEKLGDKIEEIENELISTPSQKTLQEIHKLKRESLFIRKSIWPLREVAHGMGRAESSLISDATGLYLRDVYDHTVQVIDTMETFRDMLAGMLDTYLSSLSNRMNEVMKVLTIMASIFIPLTFIAGIYGMNFEHMPELKWVWAYPVALAMMLVIAAGMIVYFRKKKWL
ncbi:MAG: magnesium/cobalt transporter CorA [Planctomycetota bacterium]|nr:magnesium/cobalt transporter CorA [Planctomycetota bacterium]